MRLLVQRVTHASVTINREEVRGIGHGAVVLLGIGTEDTPEVVRTMADKLLKLRFFEDAEGKTNLSIEDVRGDLLIISQFTLYADCRGGRRPSFIRAARPEHAIPLYEAFVKTVGTSGLMVQTGEFGADMLVDIANDGPFTIWLDSEDS